MCILLHTQQSFFIINVDLWCGCDKLIDQSLPMPVFVWISYNALIFCCLSLYSTKNAFISDVTTVQGACWVIVQYCSHWVYGKLSDQLSGSILSIVVCSFHDWCRNLRLQKFYSYQPITYSEETLKISGICEKRMKMFAYLIFIFYCRIWILKESLIGFYFPCEIL